MTAAMLAAAPADTAGRERTRFQLVLLGRLASDDGVTRSELARDLAGLVHGGKARDLIDAELAGLIVAALATENKSRFRVSDTGRAYLFDALGLKAAPKTWNDLRDINLVAASLGLRNESQARLKGLVKPDRLRAEILSASYGFKLRGAPTSPRLRSDLALVALERAFGHKIKAGISPRNGFNAKTARLLACQLLARPRDVGTDSRLVAVLAAEVVGVAKTDADALRLALLRRFVDHADDLAATISAPVARAVSDKAAHALKTPKAPRTPRAARAPQLVAPAPQAATAPLAVVPELSPPALAGPTVRDRPAAANRPGLEGFAQAVQEAARDNADGWPGNRKAFISLVWHAISERYQAWGLSAVEFKAMLAEAHRTGHLVLATADLKDKAQLKKLQDSAIAYKNTVWHLIRVVE